MPKSRVDASEVTAVVRQVVEGAQQALGGGFVGAYVTGSLTTGEFDTESDIDVVIVTEGDVNDAQLEALASMHAAVARGQSPWATEIEVSYIAKDALRRHDPKHALHPRLQRGTGQRLARFPHDSDWVVERHLLRERGITLTGPDPKTLIDAVAPNDLRDAMLPLVKGWISSFLDEDEPFTDRGHQSYVVLTLCRILYTLDHGDIVSKRVAAQWAEENFHERWRPVIQSAWRGRQEAREPVEDSDETIAFIRQITELV